MKEYTIQISNCLSKYCDTAYATGCTTFKQSPLDIGRTTPAPIPVSIPGPKPALAITPISASIVPVTVSPIAPPVMPAALLSPADLVLQLKKESLLKENPEYGDAVMAWEKTSVSLSDQLVRLEKLRQYAFGVDKWVKYFGEIVGIVPPLPEDIYEICHRNDHSKPIKSYKFQQLFPPLVGLFYFSDKKLAF